MIGLSISQIVLFLNAKKERPAYHKDKGGAGNSGSACQKAFSYDLAGIGDEHKGSRFNFSYIVAQL